MRPWGICSPSLGPWDGRCLQGLVVSWPDPCEGLGTLLEEQIWQRDEFSVKERMGAAFLCVEDPVRYLCTIFNVCRES